MGDPATDAELPLAERHPLRILLAEDNPVNQKVALLLLQRLGYEADVAADGVAALDRIRNGHVDLLVLDLGLPGMDGLEVCRRMRPDHPDHPGARPDGACRRGRPRRRARRRRRRLRAQAVPPRRAAGPGARAAAPADPGVGGGQRGAHGAVRASGARRRRRWRSRPGGRPAAEALGAAGPLPADTVFVRALRGEFDAVLAPYHDVGMTAIKVAAFGSAVNGVRCGCGRFVVVVMTPR